ncbi:MAG: DUF58 domain-containing protein [Chloroflexi bacterium]|nr:DUF58 domain-containing protein [Chloroflexota bacterium]
MAVAAWSDERAVALLALVVLLTALTAGMWSRWSLWRISYQRRLSEHRLFPGEIVEGQVYIANWKPLPLPWLEISEDVPKQFKLLNGGNEPRWEETKQARHLTTLFGYRGDRWQYRLECQMRGSYWVGPAHLRSGDPFGFFERSETVAGSEEVLVYPRLFPLPRLVLPPKEPMGDLKPRRPLLEDPLRFAGVRDYQPGDPFKRIHWKATARRAQLQVRAYEATTRLKVLLVFGLEGFDRTELVYREELFELAISSLASTAFRAQEAKTQVGLLANSRPPLEVPPSSQPRHLSAIMEALARLELASQATLASYLEHWRGRLPYGATLVVFTAHLRDPLPALLTSLRAAGHPMLVLYFNLGAAPRDLAGIPIYRVTNEEEVAEALGG